MCTVCGCGTSVIAEHASSNEPSRVHGASTHDHDHDHAHRTHHARIHSSPRSRRRPDRFRQWSRGRACCRHEPGADDQYRTRYPVEERRVRRHQPYAIAERRRLRTQPRLKPGSGKTSLLVRTITDLKDKWPIAVIEGDQQTSRDADRIRATGAPAVQINTGKGCHLDAHMVGHALDHLSLRSGSLLFIENVGNLVCPAAFDLGEAHKVVVLSVTEGEDKPLKYPDMFAAADLMLLNKADLLPHLDFDVSACLAAALRVNPRIQVLTVSARTGEGLAAFYCWIEERGLRDRRTPAP